MDGTKTILRLIAMGLLVIALVFVMGGRLLGMQFIQPELYTQANERTTARTVTLHAARGEIFDRYGRPLVTNKFSYNLTIDPGKFFTRSREIGERDVANALALIRASEGCGIPHTDFLLPVTMPPFAYNEAYTDSTAIQKRYLDHYLMMKNWPSSLTAAELMGRLFDEYGMSGSVGGIEGLLMPLYEARLVAGVLYELDLRRQAGIVERDEVTRDVIKPYLYVPDYIFAEDVTMELISIVKENKWPGIEVAPVTARQYNTEAAGHILGRIGPIQDLERYRALGYKDDELVGVEGVEKAFEEWLHGVAGEQRRESNRQGIVTGVSDIRAPQAGQNVYLTIDIRLQEELERTLAEGVTRLSIEGEALRGLEAEAAAAVIIDVKTGEVLAAANYPTYSPQTYLREYAELSADPLRPLNNRAVNGTYAPGSTFKMVTAAAAIETGTVSVNSTIYDEGMYTHYLSPQPRCHIYPGSHGHVDAVTALKVSCNYYYYDVSRRMGIDNLVSWANRFGFGLPTGFELEDPNRTRLGWVASPETSEALNIPWYPGNTLNAAIGQDNHMVTPMQLANYTAAIANGGTLNKAHLLKEVLSFDHTYEYYIAQPSPLHNLGLTPSTVKALQEGMLAVTRQGGTAYSVFRDYPVAVAGKTGSVQVGEKPNNGVFVCYAPYDDPQIAVALAVEKGGAGSTVAPIAKDILDIWFCLQEDMANEAKEFSLTR
ncbi:MAG: penicillin-binding transpeptidase domain-containing protein [Oscillospiraceae bacterium]|nr:penicillin-binding transpeptidase domain-containing protein [Oscillospiraceae bacterium]